MGILLVIIQYMITWNNLITPISCEVKISESNGITLRGFSISDFVKSHGYPIETHQNIQTKDGYLLDVHRIPHGISNVRDINQSRILLVHGLGGSAENWVLLGPNKALAFLLVDRGLDVWMINCRGTAHSRKHIKKSPEDSNFWNFSWEEMGLYDLPVVIDYILNYTNQKALFYAGHSQGCTVYFVMASERPEYNKKIRLMLGLAPGAMSAFANMPGGTYNIALQEFMHNVIKFSGFYEITGESLLLGYDPNHPNWSPLFFWLKGLVPAGASSKQFIHYGQNFVSGQFSKYNYGPEKNVELYGSETPPSYHLDRMSAPIAIFHSVPDIPTLLMFVHRLCQQIPNLVLRYLVPKLIFDHLDFIIGSSAPEVLYPKVLEIMNDY